MMTIETEIYNIRYFPSGMTGPLVMEYPTLRLRYAPMVQPTGDASSGTGSDAQGVIANAVLPTRTTNRPSRQSTVPRVDPTSCGVPTGVAR